MGYTVRTIEGLDDINVIDMEYDDALTFTVPPNSKLIDAEVIDNGTDPTRVAITFSVDLPNFVQEYHTDWELRDQYTILRSSTVELQGYEKRGLVKMFYFANSPDNNFTLIGPSAVLVSTVDQTVQPPHASLYPYPTP